MKPNKNWHVDRWVLLCSIRPTVRHDTGWTEAADAIINAMDATIANKQVTYNFAHLMEGATEIKCSEFADAMIWNM